MLVMITPSLSTAGSDPLQPLQSILDVGVLLAWSGCIFGPADAEGWGQALREYLSTTSDRMLPKPCFVVSWFNAYIMKSMFSFIVCLIEILFRTLTS